MSATRILWGQILVVLAIVLVTTWAATQWVAWKLGYQPQLGQPWFEIASGIPVYLPPVVLLVVVCATTRMRRMSSSRAPTSRPPGASLDRGRYRHVGLAGA